MLATKMSSRNDSASASSQDANPKGAPTGTSLSGPPAIHAKSVCGELYDTVVTYFLMQVVALLYKNVLLLRRNVVATLVHVLAPGLVIVVFGLVAARPSGGVQERQVESLHPATIATLGSSASGDELGLPRCQVLDVAGGRYGAGMPMPNAPCVSMLYAPATDAGVNRIVQVLAKRHGFKSRIISATDQLNNVMESIVVAEGVDILGFTDTADMIAFLDEESVYGRVGFALRFGDDGVVSRADPRLLDDLDVDGVDAPTIAYQIWTNKTFDDPTLSEYHSRMGMNNGPAIVIQRAVNEAIIGAHTGDDAAELRVGLKPFPRITGKAEDDDEEGEVEEGQVNDHDVKRGWMTVEYYFPLFLYIGVSFSFIMTLRHIVHEKQTKILDGLRMMGLSEAAYWTSWLVYYAALMFVSTWFVIAAGHAFSISTFVNSDTSLMFWCIYTYFLSMVCCAMFLSTFAPTVSLVGAARRSKQQLCVCIYIYMYLYLLLWSSILFRPASPCTP
jgi:hypothetical protein